MAGIYIRIDVDKPFGKKNIINRGLSKIRENYYFPIIDNIYLKGLEDLINLLNKNKIISHIYFRNCTYPKLNHLQLLTEGKHIIGFHAENTKNFETFKYEFNQFSKKMKTKITTFTKHGSGIYKLGKHHYPKYEPEKYKLWAKKLNIDFSFGNKIITASDINNFEVAFWIEHGYRHPSFNTINQLIEHAKNHDVVVLIHPSNYEKDKKVKKDFKKLIKLILKNNINIKTI